MKKKKTVYQSTIVSWKQGKGYGFIANPEGGDDLFLHINDIRHKRVPESGDRVRFKLLPGKAGAPAVSHVRLLRYNSLSARSWGFTLLVCGVPFVLSLHVFPYNRFPLILYSCMSGICFLLMRDDKRRAEQGRWRIPNDSIHLAQLLWGWPGTLIAQKVYRHKAQQKPFQGTLHLILFIHYVFWIDALFLDHLFLKLIIQFLQRFAGG